MTPKENILDSEVLNSSLFGEQKGRPSQGITARKTLS